MGPVSLRGAALSRTSATEIVANERPEPTAEVGLAPLETGAVKQKAPRPASSIWGFMKPAVAGVLIAAQFAAATPALAQQGVPLEQLSPPAVTQTVEAPGAAMVARYDEALRNLERLRDRGEITQGQFQGAKQRLHRVVFLGEQALLTTSGAIDVSGLISGGGTTRGEARLMRLEQALVQRMQVTARDMAYPGSYRPLEGAPGYKEISSSELTSLFGDALRDIPLGELPGGAGIARLVENLPGFTGDASKMSAREIERSLRDDARDWFKGRWERFETHEQVGLGLLTFAGITGLRAASPEVAQAMDGLRGRIFSEAYLDDQVRLRGTLVYRDARVLPDLDVSATATTTVAPRTRLYGDLTASTTIEADPKVTGTATVGVRWEELGAYHVDGSLTHYLGTDRVRVAVGSGYRAPDSTFTASTNIEAIFGQGVARGSAGGRVALTVDMLRDVQIGGAKGDLGAFVGMGVDTDGTNEDIRGGIMLRLKW